MIIFLLILIIALIGAGYCGYMFLHESDESTDEFDDDYDDFSAADSHADKSIDVNHHNAELESKIDQYILEAKMDKAAEKDKQPQLEVENSLLYFDESTGELANWTDIARPSSQEIFESGIQQGMVKNLKLW
ncbi:hypothetical protein PO250_01930 [Limosilactobacillus mucosae]|uniref:Uncharacterized protein n=1 Tax=Limosilactobacillus mucosae TaxID=97478 RepID=A0AAJ1HV70_LIMMU|nr:hypothetical protein [Limosilactobacillus mucosae]MDC2829095.1 hypothetical protein [Limosilactobacillus mucosae]